LGERALVKDWAAASRTCLEEAVSVSPPFQEAFYVDPKIPCAQAYRFDIKRGQRAEISVEREGRESARIFLDLFRVEGDSPEFWVHVASAPESETYLEFEPRLSIPYAIRLQPELLRGGRFTVTIRIVPSLGFPVAGADSRDIGSGFGAPRDGGRRKHHGVDIFARRHTPILAPSDALVRRAGEQPLGGRTVWLWDQKRNLHLYFAHLQEHKVSTNQTVSQGEKIGTVGNTGNARTTPPHLHFGVYIRGTGAVDPVDFITETNDSPSPITLGLDVLGTWVRTRNRRVILYTTASGRTSSHPPLEVNSPLLVAAASQDRYRVVLPNGATGYVDGGRVESALPGFQQVIAEQSSPIKEAPSLDSLAKDWLEPGGEADILGMFQDYWLVRTEKGLTGWMPIPQPADSGGTSAS